MDYGHKVYHDLMRQAKDSKPCKICGKHVRSQRNSKTQVKTEVMPTDRELRHQVQNLLKEAMGDFPTDHMLGYHTDNFLSLLTEATHEARIDEVRKMPRADYNTVDEYIDERLEELEKLKRTKNKEEG